MFIGHENINIVYSSKQESEALQLSLGFWSVRKWTTWLF